jgi:hypothetical protein
MGLPGIRFQRRPRSLAESRPDARAFNLPPYVRLFLPPSPLSLSPSSPHSLRMSHFPLPHLPFLIIGITNLKCVS